MGRQERLAPKTPCPRCVIGKINSGPNAHLNAVSAVDGQQICIDCRLEEIWNAAWPDSEVDDARTSQG